MNGFSVKRPWNGWDGFRQQSDVFTWRKWRRKDREKWEKEGLAKQLRAPFTLIGPSQASDSLYLCKILIGLSQPSDNFSPRMILIGPSQPSDTFSLCKILIGPSQVSNSFSLCKIFTAVNCNRVSTSDSLSHIIKHGVLWLRITIERGSRNRVLFVALLILSGGANSIPS